MLQSQGVLKQVTLWQGTPGTWPGWDGIRGINGSTFAAAYDALYTKQPWVSTVVNKLGMGEARLPLKVYERSDEGRPEARDHPYAQLLRKPHPTMNRFFFWLWVIGTFDVYGEAFLLKQRDQGGRPVALLPLHPACMREDDRDNDGIIWQFRNGAVQLDGIRDWDLVHPKTYNPSTVTRGLSKLEPLRRTLEFEDAAQRSQSSFWAKGARPGVALVHPGSLSQEAGDRLKVRWDAIAAGADNTGTTVVLEEGMKPEIMTISNEEAQYIESRKLNRGEVCAVYDVPPPAVHILDDATFSNITEQFRSLYRDTHAPRLQLFESVLEAELRDGRRPGASEPDFSDDVYAEFLLDEVLRGDFETRMAAYQTGINSGSLVINEVRDMENRPHVDGGDVAYVNSTLVPIATDDGAPVDTGLDDLAKRAEAVGAFVRAGFLPADALRVAGLPAMGHTGLTPVTVSGANAPSPAAVRTVMGRLSRPQTLAEIDAKALIAGVEPAGPFLDALAHALTEGETVAQLRDRVRQLEVTP